MDPKIIDYLFGFAGGLFLSGVIEGDPKIRLFIGWLVVAIASIMRHI